MKKLFTLFCLILSIRALQAQSPNFTIIGNSGSSFLTCTTLSLSFSATTQVTPPVYFTWTSPTSTINGANVTITQPGTYTVTIADSSHIVFGTQYLTITSNTTPPNSSVSPATQTIACNTALGTGVTSNFFGNATHTFVSPYGTSVVATGTVSYAPLGPGTYTHFLTDNTNGCQSSSTFTIVSSQNFPTFNVGSPQNYTLGCGSKSVATVNILNGNTTPAGGPVSYTFMPLSESNPLPGGVLSTTTTYTTNTPGLYYVVVRDNTSLCATQIPITILQNTVAPALSVNTPTQVLNCNVGQLVLNGSSASTNVSLNWTYPSGSVYGPSITVVTTANVTQTLVNTYTFVVTDNNNTCTSSSVIPVYQNLFPPTASITAPNNTLTCITPTVVLTNVSYSGIPPSTGFPNNQPVVGQIWYAPNQPSLGLSSTYTAATSGTYTMIAKDLNNGCTAKATAMVFGDCNLVGISKNSLSKNAVVSFPNPAHESITLVTEDGQSPGSVEIYNSLGKLIQQQNLSSSKTQLDISTLSNGIYILHIVKNDHIAQTLKIVKY